MVQVYLATADCRQNTRGFRSDAGDVVGDFVIGAVLTVGTAGLGTVAAGAKAATSVAQGARAATLAGRVGEVLAKPLMEVSVSAGAAAFARAAILGGDLFWAGKGVHTALNECDALLNQLSTASKSSAFRGSSCPGGSASPEVQLMADYRACALSAFLNVTPNLVPFTPLLVKGYRSGKRAMASLGTGAGTDAGARAQAAARLERETLKTSTRALLSEELSGVAGSSQDQWIRENVKPAFERAAASRKAWTEFADGKGLRRGERVFWVQQREIKELNEKLWNMGGTERYLATLDEEVAAVLSADPKLGRLIHQNYKDRVIVSKLSQEEFEKRVLAPARERAAEKVAQAFSSQNGAASAEIRDAWREWIRQSTDVGSGKSLMEAHLSKNPQIRAIQEQKGVGTLEAYSVWKSDAGKLRTRVDAGLTKGGVTIREAFLMLKKVEGSTAGMARMLTNRGMASEEASRVAALVVDYKNQLSVADVLPLPKKLTPLENRRLEIAAKGDYQQAHRVLSDAWVFERNLAFSKAPDAGAVVALDVQGLGVDGLVARDQWMKQGARLEELPEVYRGTSASLEERMEKVKQGIEEIVGKQVHLYQSGDDALILVPPSGGQATIRKIEAFVQQQDSLYSAVEPIPTVSSAEKRSEDIAESIHRVREKLFSQKDKGESTTALGRKGLREAVRERVSFPDMPPGGRRPPAFDFSP